MKQLFFKILNNTEMYSKQNFPIAYYPEVIFFKHFDEHTIVHSPLYKHSQRTLLKWNRIMQTI